MSKKKLPTKYFQILQSSLPLIKKNQRSLSPQQLTQSIIKDNKYVYIDLNQQSCVKIMDNIDPQDSDQQAQKYGNNLITNLRGLSKLNQKTNNYLNKLKQMIQKKQHIRSIVKQELDKSQINLKRKLNNKSQIKIYKGMDTLILKKYMEDKELENLNYIILEKQKKLISKLGIVSNYTSVTQKITNQHVLNRSGKNIQLPRLKNRTIQY